MDLDLRFSGLLGRQLLEARGIETLEGLELRIAELAYSGQT